MIEKMKKITLLVSEKERERFVSALRKEGVVHIKRTKTVTSREREFVSDRITRAENTINLLRPFRIKPSGKARDLSEKEIREKEDKIESLLEEHEGIGEDLSLIKKDLEWFDVWGEFDPRELEFVNKSGADIGLYKLTIPEYKLVKNTCAHTALAKQSGYVFAILSGKDIKESAPLDKQTVPERSPESLRAKEKDLTAKLERIEKDLNKEASFAETFEQYKKTLEKDKEFISVKNGMGVAEKLCYIEGFCPDKKKENIIELTKKNGAGYLIEDPDDPDITPTLITNPKWIKIIDPVFNFMNTLPGYDEFDISPYFLIFFSLFFAMLIGDAGYGIIFLVVTFLARRKMKHLPQEPFFLLYLLSAGTIVWGAVTGTWFGAEKIATLPGFDKLVISKISSFNGTNQNFMIYICFVIGVIQLTIAHILRCIRVINSPKALAEIGWISVLWGMFFAAGTFVIGKEFPQQAGWALMGGIVLVLFFANIEKGVVKGALTTLTDLPLSVISSFSDIVSYLRLFAVGYASVIVAQSFNDMALSGGINSIVGAAGAALILFFGHLLNIALGCMAVVVHGIRLNMLEFSGHMGMQWSGKKYKPFREEQK
ncbi:MAG: hypothetical protein P9L90_03130 [Candidatus Aadella gelida]|nr:hypothetical protein [Candidatus Aadella gelida]